MTDNIQKVLISIDTEAPAGNYPIDSLIYGKTNTGKEYGIRYLMELFDNYNAKGLFFVDFAEAWDFGENNISEVAKCIKDHGHDVGVHLHPDHMVDKKYRYLWQYNYNEQYEMISKCTDLYEKIMKKQPLSFRAGRYGANNDTIKILDKLGYKYDMSEFYGNRYCRITPPLCCNRVALVNDMDIVEIPVTSFRSFKSPFYTRCDKLDCAMDVREYERVMKKICSERTVDVISLFVHSFSLLDWRQNPNFPKPNKKSEKKLVNQLEWVKNNRNTIFISESDLNRVRINNKKDEELDMSYGIVPYYYFIKRAIRVMIDRKTLNV